ncbi:MAG: SpoIIE family protein phosphatase [Spirochaetes bacterium]|nr:SpoIIE family protein phosphatase [Spirochaetota bacterium]
MRTLSIISSFLVSVLLIYSFVVLLVKDWRDRVHQGYAFISIAGFGIIFTMFLQYAFPEIPYLTQINRLTQMSFILFSAGLVNMSFVYPIRKNVIFPFKYKMLFLFPAIIISYIAVFTDLNITKAYFEGETLIREYGVFFGIKGFWYSVYSIVAAIYLFFSAGNYIRLYRKTDIVIYHIQLKYIFISSSAVIAAVVFSVVMPRFFNYTEFYVLGPSIAAFACVGAFFYGIISFDMMDITSVVRKAAIYFVISITVIIPIYGLIQLYYMNIHVFREFPQFIIEVSLVALFILYSIYVQPAIYRLFELKKYKFESILDKFTIDIVAEIRDPRRMIEKTVDILFEKLELERAFFINYDNNSKKFELYYRRGDAGPVDLFEKAPVIIEWFLRNKNILQMNRLYTDDKSFSETRDLFIEFFEKYRIKIILPLFHRKRVMGLICLGEKASSVPFKLFEIMKLHGFQREINVHISNSFTYKQAMREELMQRTLDLSADILTKSVPFALPNLPGIRFGAFYIPRHKDRMDYFDFLKAGSQGIGVIATDMPGIGFDGALQSVMLKSSFQTSLNEAPSSFSIMQRLNRVLFDYYKDNFTPIKSYYFYYDIKSMRLVYTNAGFPPLDIFRIELNDFEPMDTDGVPLGSRAGAAYGMGRTTMLRGDIGMLYSHALTRANNKNGETFGLSRLQGIITSIILIVFKIV